MKKVGLIIFTNFLVLSLSAQGGQVHRLKVSYNQIVSVDSFRLYEPYDELAPLDLTEFSNDLVSTPLKACQAFMSFDTKEVGKELASSEYGLGAFPSDEGIEFRKNSEYKNNRYLKVFSVLYFKYNGIPHANTYFEMFINESLSRFYLELSHKYVNGKWLLVDDWYLSRFSSISKLKPQYAKALISGKQIEGNNDFNKLLDAVYSTNRIDIGVLDEFLKNKEYSNLLNEE